MCVSGLGAYAASAAAGTDETVDSVAEVIARDGMFSVLGAAGRGGDTAAGAIAAARAGGPTDTAIGAEGGACGGPDSGAAGLARPGAGGVGGAGTVRDMACADAVVAAVAGSCGFCVAVGAGVAVRAMAAKVLAGAAAGAGGFGAVLTSMRATGGATVRGRVGPGALGADCAGEETGMFVVARGGALDADDGAVFGSIAGRDSIAGAVAGTDGAGVATGGGVGIASAGFVASGTGGRVGIDAAGSGVDAACPA